MDSIQAGKPNKPRPGPLNLKPPNPQPNAKQHAAPTTTGGQIRKRQEQFPPIWPKLKTNNPSSASGLAIHLLQDVNHTPESSEGNTWNTIFLTFLRETLSVGKRRRHKSCPSRISCRSRSSTPPAFPANQAPLEADVTVLDLPDPVITQIISLLPIRDVVCGLRQTCTRLHGITGLPYTWKRVEMTFNHTTDNKAEDLVAGRYYSGLLGQRFTAFRVRGLDHDSARHKKEGCGDAVLVSGRREGSEDGAEKSAVLNREGSLGGPETSVVLNREGSLGGPETSVVLNREECGDGAQKSAVLNREECKDGVEKSAVLNRDRSFDDDEKSIVPSREESKDGVEKSVVQNRQVAKDEDDAGHGSSAADEETSWVECVETDMRSVVRSLSENYVDLSRGLTSLSIVNGALYPCLQELSLISDFFPDPAFLSRHTGLHSLFLNITAPWWAPDYPMDNIRKMFHEIRPCKSLEILKIQMQKNVVYEQMFMTVDMWSALLGYFASGPVLRRLRLDMPVDDVIVRSILDHCPQLEELQLHSRCLIIDAFENLLETPNTSITFLSLDCFFTDPRLVYVISKAFRGLTDLWLTLKTPANALESYEDLPYWQQAIDTLMLPQAFPKLTVLNVHVYKSNEIAKARFRTNDPLFCLNSQPVKGKLEDVNITDDTNDFYFNFHRVCSAHPHLKVLDIVGTPRQFFPEQAKENQAMTWLTLKEICCFSLCAVSPTGMAILRSLPDLEQLPCRVIQAPSGQPEMSCPVIQETSGQPVGSVSDPVDDPLNELIAIQWTDSGDINLILMPRPFPHLTSLSILQCPRLCDQDVLDILLSCPRLEHLWLESRPPTGPPLLTEKTLHNLLDLGTELRYVMIPHMMELSSPDTLARLLTRSPALATLSINAAHYEDERFMVDLLHAWWWEVNNLRITKPERERTHIAVRPKQLRRRDRTVEELVCFSIRKRAVEAEGEDDVRYFYEP